MAVRIFLRPLSRDEAVDDEEDDEDDELMRALICSISFLIRDSNHFMDFSSSATKLFIVLKRHRLSCRLPKAR